MKYFSKNIVEAVQYLGNNTQEMIDFTNNQVVKHEIYSCLVGLHKNIETGDYVVKTESGFEVYTPNHFENKFTKLK